MDKQSLYSSLKKCSFAYKEYKAITVNKMPVYPTSYEDEYLRQYFSECNCK